MLALEEKAAAMEAAALVESPPSSTSPSSLQLPSAETPAQPNPQPLVTSLKRRRRRI